ncbi:MAG: DUF2520 domain-containing protein [Acidobacteriia bacterium]|nr:DUF2520 domain-containing protein [Terriglobia bacterium]
MSRELESPVEFALVGAGPAATSLAGALAHGPGRLGPVVGVSYRVASRLANSLGIGTPARDTAALRNTELILFHAPLQQMKILADQFEHAGINWSGKNLIFVDCDSSPMERAPMSNASFAWITKCPIPGRLAVGGSGTARVAAIRLASAHDRRPLIVPATARSAFQAAMLLGGAALTPLIDSVAHILRGTGMLDKVASQTAVALFTATIQAYARSGRQSWEWHVHEPDIDTLESHLNSLQPAESRVLRELLLLGFERFQRHSESAEALRSSLAPELPPE